MIKGILVTVTLLSSIGFVANSAALEATSNSGQTSLEATGHPAVKFKPLKVAGHPAVKFKSLEVAGHPAVKFKSLEVAGHPCVKFINSEVA